PCCRPPLKAKGIYMRYIIGILAAVFAVFGLATAVQAQNTATQNAFFTVPASLSISSTGDVNLGTAAPGTTVTKTGSFTLASNDVVGFDLTTSIPSATITESLPPGGTGTCAGAVSIGGSVLSVAGSAVTGFTSGSGGTAAASHPLSTTAT